MPGCRFWGYSGVSFLAGFRREVLSESEIALQIALEMVKKEVQKQGASYHALSKSKIGSDITVNTHQKSVTATAAAGTLPKPAHCPPCL